jgi:hypothetical protein
MAISATGAVASSFGLVDPSGSAQPVVPGGRIVEEQANRFAAELLMPADEIHDLLPTLMGRNAWIRLGLLKEQWGVSIQALLFRARRLGRLSDVSYRNAMTTVSTRGWRRGEPGLVNTIEQPSLLPKAIELLKKEGASEALLVEQCRVPVQLFRVVTGRVPEQAQPAVICPRGHSGPDAGGKVVSLLGTRQTTSASPR